MDLQVTWTEIKDFATTRSRPIQYVDFNGNYYLYINEGPFSLNAIISQEDPANADLIDFETNYKPSANKPIINNVATQSHAPFGAKTMIINGVTKRLFARFTGSQTVLAAGANTIDMTISYPWVKIVGIEVINCEALDTADFSVLDTPTGTYFGTPSAVLNQFSYTLNLPKDYYLKMAQFDADIYQNMVIRIGYTSVSAKTIGINLLINEVKT